MSEILLSIVIPAYNEAKRLPKTLTRVKNYCKTTFGNSSYEIIIVDDGSTDGTANINQDNFSNISVVCLPHNQGKGSAVKEGVLRARGLFTLVMDADGATPIEEEKKLRERISTHSPIVIGSRASTLGKRHWIFPFFSPKKNKDAKVQWHVLPHRHFLGRIFALMVNICLGFSYRDTQCGFKMFETSIGKMLFSKCKSSGFIFDVEFLYLAKIHNISVEEIAVFWHEQKGSKVRLWKDPFVMFFQVLKLSCLRLLPPTQPK